MDDVQNRGNNDDSEAERVPAARHVREPSDAVRNQDDGGDEEERPEKETVEAATPASVENALTADDEEDGGPNDRPLCNGEDESDEETHLWGGERPPSDQWIVEPVRRYIDGFSSHWPDTSQDRVKEVSQSDTLTGGTNIVRGFDPGELTGCTRALYSARALNRAQIMIDY